MVNEPIISYPFRLNESLHNIRIDSAMDEKFGRAATRKSST